MNRNRKYSAFTMLICFIAILNSCSSVLRKEKNNDITGIKISQRIPVLNDKGKLMRYDTLFTSIYKYRDQILYHSPYRFDSTVNDTILKSEIRYYHFVYKKGSLFGLLYDSGRMIFGKKEPVDSMLKTEWCQSINIYQGFLDNSLTLISSRSVPDSGILNKVYSFRGIKDTGRSGTCSFWFTHKLKNIEYSLSRELDSANKMKLYKVRIKNNQQYFKDYNYTLDSVEQEYDLEEIVIVNKLKIFGFFQKEE